MADGDRVVLAGWTVREDHRLHWSQGLSDREWRMVVCGEIGHARHLIFVAAVRQAAEEHLDTLLVEMAQRVGVEYSPTQRRREAPENEATESNRRNS